MVRSVLASLASLCLLLAPALAAQAADAPVLSRIVKTGKLRVGMSGDQPPMNMRA